MADEITVDLEFIVSKDPFYFKYDLGAQTYDLSGAGGGNPGLVSVGTSEEDIDFGDVTGEGILFMKNLDAASDVDWGVQDTTMKAIGTLKVGGIPAILNIKSGTTLRMQSTGGGAAKCYIGRFEV